MSGDKAFTPRAGENSVDWKIRVQKLPSEAQNELWQCVYPHARRSIVRGHNLESMPARFKSFDAESVADWKARVGRELVVWNAVYKWMVTVLAMRDFVNRGL